MPYVVFRSAVLMALLVIVLPGCGYFQSADADVDDETADFDAEEVLDPDAEEKTAGDSEVVEGELELKLKVGDRFPLVKRIDQRLQQGDGQGGMLTNRSMLEMLLSLVVEEERDGNKRLSVRYHRIKYGHNIAGRSVEYNSDNAGPVPTEALVYAGLKDNGFSFWIGPDNRVTELVGFQDFLQRCLRDVPTAFRNQVLRQLEGTQSEDGLANFVDDGIGLLPYSNDPQHPAVAVKVGSTWELKPRRSEGPIPMNVTTRCVLKNLTEKSAEISLVGRIIGTARPVAYNDGARSMQILLKDGHCAGQCTIDRRTGLPTQSEVSRYMEMTVTLPNGVEIPQRKEVLTSITSFLDQGSGTDSAVGMTPTTSSSQVAQTSELSSGPGTQRVSTAGGERSVFGGSRISDR